MLKITDFKCCPHCNGTAGYYSKVTLRGTYNDNTGWDGKKENTEMMDSFKCIKESKFYYCQDCDELICKR